MKIYSLKQNSLNENDRLALGNLLLKAGYCVKIDREKPPGKNGGAYNYYVEFWDDTNISKKGNGTT